jgi:hypothetical protein
MEDNRSRWWRGAACPGRSGKRETSRRRPYLATGPPFKSTDKPTLDVRALMEPSKDLDRRPARRSPEIYIFHDFLKKSIGNINFKN